MLHLSVHHVSASPFHLCVVLQDQFTCKSDHIYWHVHQCQAQDTCSLFTDINLSSHKHHNWLQTDRREIKGLGWRNEKGKKAEQKEERNGINKELKGI